VRTIQQFVTNGIANTSDLQEALLLAMQLEFSTIPPYLCAQWSIDPNNDPSDVSDMIQAIVVQEMFHFALAGNMLTAIGGLPQVADTDFIPTYPTHTLPGDIAQVLAVDLQRLSTDQLMVFMQIELPEFPPVELAAKLAQGPATVGAFYTTLAAGFNAVNPQIVPGAHAVRMGEAVPITSIADALAAIQRIQEEGEGTPSSPDQPTPDGKQLAHYYVFKGIRDGKALDTGFPITMPKAFSFTPSSAIPNPSSAFNQALTQLLQALQNCWVNGARPNIGAMNDLETLGVNLIQQGIRPQFIWDAD
jgi:Ferritin-like